MKRQSTVGITVLTLCIFIMFLAVGIWIRFHPSKSSVIFPLPPINPTSISSPTVYPTLIHTPSAKPSPSVAPIAISTPPSPVMSTPTVRPAPATPVINNKTPTPVTQITTTPVPAIMPTLTPIPPLISITPAVLDRMNIQPQCQYDTHGGAPYIVCDLTLRDTSSTQTATWTASIDTTYYTLKPNSGELAPGKTTVIQFVALPLGCPASYMITVKSNVNTVHVPVLCTDVIVNPSGTVFANDICGQPVANTYTCHILLLASSYNTIPAQWEASTYFTTGNAQSVTFSPSTGTLAPNSVVTITITIVDPQCPDTVELVFFVPDTPGLPQSNNMMNWTC